MLKEEFTGKIGRYLGNKSRFESVTCAPGGSINHCYILHLDSGRALFAKTHKSAVVAGMYQAEFLALERLRASSPIAVPEPLYHDDEILLLEAFSPGNPALDWQEKMGAGLAALHEATGQVQFGFDCDNFLGTTLQPNTWQDDWLAFWRVQRLGHQLALFEEKSAADNALVGAGRQLLDTLDSILACDPEPAVLLHGDLWSGNAAANEKGEPVIYDPASYYGHREAEFGMMRLFGGFGPRCEAAYQEVWPLQPGHDRRIEAYRLYHQLNHLNLFGSSYYQGCLDTIRGLL